MIRKHGEDVENDRGRRLLSFSAENALQVILTSTTSGCTSSCGCVLVGNRIIIDYCLVHGDLREGHDVKVIRGAETGSDLHLVVMKMNLLGISKTNK